MVIGLLLGLWYCNTSPVGFPVTTQECLTLSIPMMVMDDKSNFELFFCFLQKCSKSKLSFTILGFNMKHTFN